MKSKKPSQPVKYAPAIPPQMLTDAELESLDRAAKEIKECARKEFGELNRQTSILKQRI